MMFKDFLNSRLPIKSQASYVEFGYGQVEPNHLSAQRTAQIYAQLPAAADINILEQGQFVKYDYAANANGIGEVNFTGAGEWMMVYNEIKLYRNHPDGSKQWDCEFAMIKDDYQARIYSPYDYEMPEQEYHNGLYLNGKDSDGNTSISISRTFTADAGMKTITIGDQQYAIDAATHKFTYNGTQYEIDPTTGETKTKITVTYAYDDVTKDVEDIYEIGFTNDPWKKLGIAREKKMPAGTAMVPRVIKTNVGDIYTTNLINETSVTVGDVLYVGEAGILCKTAVTEAIAASAATETEPAHVATAVSGDMKWQVVKVYTMPDGQKGVKVMRIQ